MRLLEPMVTLGMWVMLGIAADSTEYAEAVQMTEQVLEAEETSDWWTEEKEEIETEETETELESESESETEEKCIYVTQMKLVEVEREYDGTTGANVAAEVTGLPEGMKLSLCAEAEKADVGTWPVRVQAVLEGEESEQYQIEIEEQPLWLTIHPRPLRIRISNARKCYYSENAISNLIFEREDPIEISGFLECDQKENGLPEGFEWPELTIDETVLQKESPMYEKGREITYQDAVTIKRNPNGTLTGNPTKNYTFNIEETEFFDGGDVILSPAPISGTLDYTTQCLDPEAIKMDANGNLWIRNGETLVISPTLGNGFTEGKIIRGIYGDGTEEFTLIRRNQAGEIVAESQIRSISWHADTEAPKGRWMLEKKQMQEGHTCYVNCDTQLAYAYVQDMESGVKSVKIYAAYGEERGLDGETLYQEKQKEWREDGRILLDRQGSCKVWVRTEDQVGNVRYESSEEIVIDHTAPEIWFENIQAGSANRDKVEPVCIIRDEYLQADSLKVTLSGYQSKNRQVNWTQKQNKPNEIELRMENLPEAREWDDVYTLRAEAKDLSGNCSSREIVFSVNRFGSVYYLGEEARTMAEQFYVSCPTDVKIYEVNVDYLTESGILLGHEGESRILQKDRDYTVKKTGDDKTWKEYCYTISSGCFEEEGRYYLICSSEDRALHSSDNRMKKQSIEFAVDKSEPDILLAGIEEAGIYKENTKTVSLECRDNLALQEVTVWLNGKKLFSNEKEEQEITLQEKNGWQSIRVKATDKAGNSKDTGELHFWLGKEEARPMQQTTLNGKKDLSSHLQSMTKAPQEMEKESSEAQEEEKSGKEKNWKVLAGIAIVAVIWGIFLKTKTEK